MTDDPQIVGEAVELALSDFLQDSSPAQKELREIASAKHVLPLYLDWNGCLAIRPNGQLIWFDYDTPDVVRIEEDPRIRNLALFRGSKKHPAIQCLIPNRPINAATCPHCGGTGELPEPMKKAVCFCGGLGWLPPNFPVTGTLT